MNAPLIPQANPGAAFRSRRDALLKAAADVLDGGWYINGKQVRQFEESFAAFCSVKHAVGVGNGTDAIEVALRALGIGKGGLVFTVSHTAVATVAAIDELWHGYLAASRSTGSIGTSSAAANQRRLSTTTTDASASACSRAGAGTVADSLVRAELSSPLSPSSAAPEPDVHANSACASAGESPLTSVR